MHACSMVLRTLAVNCKVGKNRTPMVIAVAYLAYYHETKLSVDDALWIVSRHRPIMEVNEDCEKFGDPKVRVGIVANGTDM